MSDKKRENMKEDLKKFDRKEYERKILNSLKKATNVNVKPKFPRVEDRGGR